MFGEESEPVQEHEIDPGIQNQIETMPEKDNRGERIEELEKENVRLSEKLLSLERRLAWIQEELTRNRQLNESPEFPLKNESQPE